MADLSALEPFSRLESPQEIAFGILEAISSLLVAAEPTIEEDGKVQFGIFSVFATGHFGEAEMERAVIDHFQTFNPPKLSWTAVTHMADVNAIANAIYASRNVPKTQILTGSNLELLTIDETLRDPSHGGYTEAPWSQSKKAQGLQLSSSLDVPQGI